MKTYALRSFGLIAGGLALLGLVGVRRRSSRPPAGPAPEAAASRERTQRLESLFSHAAVGFAQVRLADGRFLDVNPKLCRMLHYSRADLLRKSFRDITPPEDLQQEEPLLRRLVAQELPSYSIEKRYYRSDGTSLWVRVTSWLLAGARTGLRSTVIEDISQQKAAQEALRRSEELYRLTIENARDFALVALDLDGRIVQWNIGAERVYGRSAQEAIGQHVEIIFTPEDRAAGIPQQELRGALKDHRASDERWHIRKDGTRFYFVGSVWPLHDPAGHIRGFAKIGTDLTERKRLEEELQQARAYLEQTVAQRTASLTQAIHDLEIFSYSLSHDLRAPLRGVASYAQIVQARFGHALPPEGQELLRRITEAADRLDHLVQDVLTYHRVARESLRLHPVNLEPLLDQVLSQLPDLRLSGATLTIERPLLRVLGHQALLTQCLSNLLANSLRFVPPQRSPQVHLFTTREGNWVNVCLRDNGIGIAPEDQDKIWGIFNRLHPETYPGTGIGLAIVRKAVERMGGSISLQSQPGQGSTFCLRLLAA